MRLVDWGVEMESGRRWPAPRALLAAGPRVRKQRLHGKTARFLKAMSGNQRRKKKIESEKAFFWGAR